MRVWSNRRQAVLAVVVVAALMAFGGLKCGWCATIFQDGFEPSINGNIWKKGPSGWGGAQGHEDLKGDSSHIRTPGVNSAREWVNYRVTYNSQCMLPIPFDNNVYLKCWMFEDNDIPWPVPPPPYDEQWPNGYITLLDTTSPGAEVFMIGVMGEIGRLNNKNRAFFDNCCVYTATDGYQVLNGTSGKPLVPRRQGWRKYTIVIKDYTGNPGDVQFFIDDKLVFNGRRASLPWGGGAPIDTIVLGSKWWTYETYWFDHVDFGMLETPVECAHISEALSLPDDAWVTLTGKVVAGCFTKNPFPGYLAIEEDDRSAAVWVSTSYVASVSPTVNQAERLNVTGIMRTNEAGMRYVDAIHITQASASANQPRPLGTALKNLAAPGLDGKLVKVWGKVVNVPGSSSPTVRGQERKGDWRRYFLITDGSPGSPVKCYYDNIISGVDPVPTVKEGDYVSVVGVAGREVLVPGTSAPECSVWIRGTGDLRILRPAP
ncbi:MAG: hypothetical protein QHI38_12915 [Armatimonadota bacterium]|nr:hypothetical protein [Armatimonadota bacterium]